MSTSKGKYRVGVPLFGLGALFVPLIAGAQAPVPIHGVTGTIALQPNVDEFYSGLNKALVKTSDGFRHISGAPDGKKVHENSASLDSLSPGTPVVVRYTVKGIQASADPIEAIEPDSARLNEGIVSSVDRRRRQITIKFADGATETLHFKRSAGKDSNGRGASRVVVDHWDPSGRKVTQYFKRVAS